MTDEPAEGGGTPEPAAAHDWYYHGTIKRVYYGSEYHFKFPFVQILGPIPRVDGLREGMPVGFDVGWTSRGLRVTVIRVY